MIKKLFFLKKEKKKIWFFSSFFINIKSIFIKYETDLITFPAKKEVLVVTKGGPFKWKCNYKKNCDAVIYHSKRKKIIKLFKKTRTSEFKNEIKHIFSINNKKQYILSPINLDNALKVFKLMKECLI